MNRIKGEFKVVSRSISTMRLLLLLLVYAVCLWRVSQAFHACSKEYLQPYNNSNRADYYWRDYDGTIPNDAIEGGLEDGEITYIGQVLHRESVLPAMIYPGQKEALSNAYGATFRSDKSLKILCSQYKDLFRWISTSINEMYLLTDFVLVIGGTEGHVLNIARVNFEQRIIIGKVFPVDASNKGLWLAKRNGQEQNLLSFEILAFEKRIPSSCHDVLIALRGEEKK